MFYVYEAKIDDTIIYVGKGTKRRYTHCYRKWKHCVVEIIEYFDSAEDAFKKEEELIKHYGRLDLGTGTLFNKSNGGKYIKGAIPWKGKKLSLEHKDNIGKALKGNPNLSIPRYGIENSFYGKKHTEKTKQDISLKRRGTVSGFKGKKHSKEAIEKNRMSHLGKPSKKKMLIDEDILINLKYVDKLTNKQISEYFGCSLFPIKKALKQIRERV
jgi:hypothetical protein